MVVVAKSLSQCRAALKQRQIPCPDCGQPLRPRGFAGPLKKLRGAPAGEDVLHGPRPRGQCGRCRRSHVLQPAAVAAHRSDTLPVLARAVLARALGGLGATRIAALLGRAVPTVRGWLGQARVFARRHLPALTSWLTAMGAEDLVPRLGEHDLLTELVLVLRALAHAAAARWGDAGLTEWERINVMCRGRFMSATLPVPVYHELIHPGTA